MISLTCSDNLIVFADELVYPHFEIYPGHDITFEESQGSVSIVSPLAVFCLRCLHPVGGRRFAASMAFLRRSRKRRSGRFDCGLSKRLSLYVDLSIRIKAFSNLSKDRAVYPHLEVYPGHVHVFEKEASANSSFVWPYFRAPAGAVASTWPFIEKAESVSQLVWPYFTESTTPSFSYPNISICKLFFQRQGEAVLTAFHSRLDGTGYPQNLNEIYPGNSMGVADIQSTDLATEGLTANYPVFSLYPAQYPFFEIYPGVISDGEVDDSMLPVDVLLKSPSSEINLFPARYPVFRYPHLRNLPRQLQQRRTSRLLSTARDICSCHAYFHCPHDLNGCSRSPCSSNARRVARRSVEDPGNKRAYLGASEASVSCVVRSSAHWCITAQIDGPEISPYIE